MTQNTQIKRPPTPGFVAESGAQGWTLRDLFEQLRAAENLNQEWFDQFGHLLSGGEPTGTQEIEEALEKCPASLGVVAGWLGCLHQERMMRHPEADLAPVHQGHALAQQLRPGLHLS